LFNTGAIPPCAACHVAPFTASPSLEGFGETAATRVEGMSAQEYAFYSIVQPEAYIVEGFGNAMYNKYGEDLSAQDIADLIAYLLAQ
jgi:cytochrome c553